MNDVSVDRHFLIGTNLDGLLNYVRDAWNEYVQGVSLEDATRGRTPLDMLEGAARRFRIPYREEHVREHLRAMLEGLGLADDAQRIAGLWGHPEQLRQAIAGRVDEATAKELQDHLEHYARSYAELRAARRARRHGRWRRRARRRLPRPALAVVRAQAGGDRGPAHQRQPDHRPHRALQPAGPVHPRHGDAEHQGDGAGLRLPLAGLERLPQGLRGPVQSGTAEVAERGLRMLAGFQEYNALCEEKVRAAIETARHSPLAQNESFQAELTVIESNLDNAMEQLGIHLAVAGGGSRAGLLTRALAHIEAFLDAGDAVRRRKRANLISRELVEARISHERAALELQALNKRQKGGWLQHKLETLLRRAN